MVVDGPGNGAPATCTSTGANSAVGRTCSSLAADQLFHLLVLRTAALDHMKEALGQLAKESASKDTRILELERTTATLRADARAKNELFAKVELEIISMREQVKRTKGHYESLMQRGEADAQRSVLAAQQAVTELRGQLDQAVLDNQRLQERIGKLKSKHARQLEQLQIRQKQELFIAEQRTSLDKKLPLTSARHRSARHIRRKWWDSGWLLPRFGHEEQSRRSRVVIMADEPWKWRSRRWRARRAQGLSSRPSRVVLAGLAHSCSRRDYSDESGSP